MRRIREKGRHTARYACRLLAKVLAGFLCASTGELVVCFSMVSSNPEGSKNTLFLMCVFFLLFSFSWQKSRCARRCISHLTPNYLGLHPPPVRWLLRPILVTAESSHDTYCVCRCTRCLVYMIWCTVGYLICAIGIIRVYRNHA